jgi:DNA invertase Pin-like site-specific DNA recombinase
MPRNRSSASEIVNVGGCSFKRHLWTVQWTWNQDRLARDTEQFLWYYRQLDNAKARIFEGTNNDFIDMTTLGGRVKHTQLAAAAEIFRMVTSEKVKKAYERNKKLGKPWGRKKTPWDIAKARELRDAGKGWRSIAKEVGVSYQTVRRELQGKDGQFSLHAE